MNNYNLKIAICTKGRGGSTTDSKGNIKYQAINPGKIYQHALNNDINELNNVYLFIEPNDVNSYMETYSKWPKSNIIVLGDNNQGLAFTRQTALQYFQETEPSDIMCMLDDDAVLYEYYWGFHEKKGIEKWMMREVPLVEGLNKCAEYLQTIKESDKVGIAALEYNHYSWSKEADFPSDGSFLSDKMSDIGSDHSYCDCIVFWYPKKYKEYGISYDNYPLKADRDFAMQVAFKGLYNRKIFRFVMDSPLNGKAPGGCQDWYKKENQEKSECEELVTKWNAAFNKAELIQLKEKKTSYGRAHDVKWFWARAYYARVKDKITYEVKNLRPIPESVNNYVSLDKYLEQDA